MIEWLLIGGGAILSLLGTDEKRTPTRSWTPPPPDPSELIRRTAAKEAEWRSKWEREIDRTRWIPQSVAHRILKTHPLKDAGAISVISTASKIDELLVEFAKHNMEHLTAQKLKLKPFFDTVEKNPLTEEQTDACICMDDAVQVVASAGSGKTSTMVAKTGYVLHERLAKPEQILLLAFNNDAASELRERVRSRLRGFDGIERVTVSTFHKFGQDVITKIKGKPAVADWVGSPNKENEAIVAIVDDLRKRDPGFGLDWDLFRTVYGRDTEHFSEMVRPNAESKGDIRTAKGDWVKSGDECLIANWLFYHGVDYEYEGEYEHDTRTPSRRQYKPDFFYPGIGLYHEHFALDKNGHPPPAFGDYLAGVHWKRKCHERHATDLIETTSYGIRSQGGLEGLRDELTKRGLELSYDASKPVKGRPPISALELAGLVRTFQQHVKGGLQSIDDIKRRLGDSEDGAHIERAQRFIALYEPIAAEWERRLRARGSIDFDDMLAEAVMYIESGRFESPYTLIFADEFQDSSRARLRLLKALLDRTEQRGHLCVVGDDWQSINRFAGADLSVMTAFKNTFPHSTRLDLGTTFRCPLTLCELSTAFIRVNPKQLEKVVVTTNQREGPAIAVFANDSSEATAAQIHDHLQKLYQHVGSEGAAGPVAVLMLGRYNRDRPRAIEGWSTTFRDRLDITFKTIHRSKGLEADYVMILGMDEGEYGFPSQVADDPILKLAMPEREDFPMAEERRMFYVALTRAKRQVRIYTSASRPSRFLLEMAKADLITIRRTGGGSLEPCPKCAGGILTRRNGSRGAFDACSTCNFKRNLKSNSSDPPIVSKRVMLKEPVVPGISCTVCGKGQMKVLKGWDRPMAGCSEYPTCRTTAPLLRSESVEGDLHA